MFVYLPSTRVVAEGTFDVQVQCASCQKLAWARVSASASSLDYGPSTAVSLAQARSYAMSMAHFEAIQSVRGCRCPFCGEWDRQIVQWVRAAEERARRRAFWRKWFWAVTFPCVPLAAGVLSGALLLDDLMHHGKGGSPGQMFGFTFFMMLCGWLGALPVAWFAFRPLPNPGARLYEVPPDDVKFLDEGGGPFR